NDDDSGNDDDDGNDADDSERTDSKDDKNPSFTLKDYEEEEHDKEYVHSPENSESDDDQENVDEEEYDDRYKDVDMKSLIVENAHVTLTALQKTDDSKQSSFVSSDFANQILILEKAPPSDHEEFEKKAQEERKFYIDVVEKLVKDIIKDEVRSQLPQILPKEVLDFVTPVIQSTITKSLENVFLAESFSQPKSTYEATTSLTEFELKKILLDKIEKSKSYQATPKHRELYDGLVKSYNLNKDLFSS
ncbi:hypothetical protein Tco_0048535, partial [Tanacetum coccineum]